MRRATPGLGEKPRDLIQGDTRQCISLNLQWVARGV